MTLTGVKHRCTFNPPINDMIVQLTLWLILPISQGLEGCTMHLGVEVPQSPPLASPSLAASGLL